MISILARARTKAKEGVTEGWFAKFPKDVIYCEQLTKGNPNILNEEPFAEKKKEKAFWLSKWWHQKWPEKRKIDLAEPLARQAAVDAISEEAVYGDILDYVGRDGSWMVIATSVGILLIIMIAFRSFRNVAVAVISLLLGGATAIGLMGLLDVSVNFVNVVVFPIWLGLGVDAIFHLMGRSDADANDLDGYLHTVSAVFAAFATTAIGFGAMSISSHRGLASLGLAAIIGLACLFVTAVLVQLALWRTREIEDVSVN